MRLRDRAQKQEAKDDLAEIEALIEQLKTVNNRKERRRLLA